MTKHDEFIVLAHNNDIDGASEWGVWSGANAEAAAKATAARWLEQGWRYVAVRPVGDIIFRESGA